MQAFIKCLEKQRSYREIAFNRGVDYRNIRSPFNQTPPVPSPQEVVELERQAGENLRKAMYEVMHKRGLLYTNTFKSLQPTLLHYDPTAYKEAWDKHLDRKNVPHGVRLYPGFSDFVDASTYIASIPMGADATQLQDPSTTISNPDRPRRDVFGLQGIL
uniref:Uncharacterized protein n=1 Tax=Lygus hesperus TaxID=30085 RepID=A0A0A9W8J8_LYGHE